MYFASARIGPPLNRGSIVALKSFETENNAAFPLPFRGFVIKNTSSLLQLANFVIFKALSTDLSFKSATFSFRIQKFTRPHVIGFVADLFFFTLESGLNNIRIRRKCVDGSRIREEKFVDSKIAGYV